MDQSFQSSVSGDRVDNINSNVNAPFLERTESKKVIYNIASCTNEQIIDNLDESVDRLKLPIQQIPDKALIQNNPKETFASLETSQPTVTKCSILEDKINSVLQNTTCEAAMSIITIYILYSDDLRVLATDKNGDNLFYGASFICFIIFMTELILLAIVRQGYIFSFFFWMDILSTLSTAMDIPWVVDALSLSILSAQTSFVKAGRASKISARATKIIRIIRLIRIIRVAKLYYNAQQALARKFMVNEQVHSMRSEFSEFPRILQNNRAQHDKQFRLRASSLKELNFSIYDPPSNRNTYTQTNALTQKNFDYRMEVSPAKKINKRGSIMMVERRDQNDPYLKFQNSTLVKTMQQDLDCDESSQNLVIVQKSRLDTRLEKLEINRIRHRALAPLKDQKLINRINFVTNGKLKSVKVVPESLVPVQSLEDHDVIQPEVEQKIHQETNVGRTLSHLTTKRAIFLIFSVIVSIPLFEFSTYYTTTDSYVTGINILNSRYTEDMQNNDFQFVLQEYINFHRLINQGMILGRITINSKVLYNYNKREPESFRQEELIFYEIFADENKIDTEVIIIDQYDSRLNAILGITRTTFVILILASGAIYFSKDANDYVVVPIENMLMKVRRIANNPLEAAKIQQDEDILEEEIRKCEDVEKVKEHLERSHFETAILEKLIVKTGMLLALGFGEAGANIIAENMRKGDAVNPLVSGTRMFGIFGFCDIRNFTDMTEVLQEGVMLFVNDIASIVHSNGIKQ